MDYYDLFLRKSGDPGFDEEVYEAPFGFFSGEPKGDIFYVWQMSGDGDKMEALILETARRLGCTKLRWMTYRNPKAWERRFNCKQIGYVLEKEVPNV
jgi:hypothetical protein